MNTCGFFSLQVFFFIKAPTFLGYGCGIMWCGAGGFEMFKWNNLLMCSYGMNVLLC